ncbi:hypothetical protein [Allofustis seminis]|uniref:hypothetical protein n=1 Tax=Allofustis seminis TaxID=166939 RepID=UPI00036ED305|nr:hypothetical protein [Allofustis seminis]
MKTKWKGRVFAGLSALAMGLSILPMNAFAQQEPFVEDNPASTQNEVPQSDVASVENGANITVPNGPAQNDNEENIPLVQNNVVQDEVAQGESDEAVAPLHEANHENDEANVAPVPLPLQVEEPAVTVEKLNLVAKTADGKYYGIMTLGDNRDIEGTRSFYELTEEQYNEAKKDFLLTFKRKDGKAFTLPHTKFQSTDQPTGEIFTEVQIKNHQIYSASVGDPVLSWESFNPTQLVEVEDVVWSITLHKDWVIEGDPEFATGTSWSSHIDGIYICYICEIDGQGHRIYSKSNETSRNSHRLIYLDTDSENEDTLSVITIKNITIDGSLDGLGETPAFGGMSVGVFNGKRNTAVDLAEDVHIKNCLGGVYLHKGTGLIMNASCTIENCHYQETGSNPYIDPNQFTFSGGGAIAADGWAHITINGGKFINNSSTTNGGAIYTPYGQSKTVIKNAEFIGNSTAEQDGY